jgi:hypothetical protein
MRSGGGGVSRSWLKLELLRRATGDVDRKDEARAVQLLARLGEGDTEVLLLPCFSVALRPVLGSPVRCAIATPCDK